MRLGATMSVYQLKISSLMTRLSSNVMVLIFGVLALGFDKAAKLTTCDVLTGVTLMLITVFAKVKRNVRPVIDDRPNGGKIPMHRRMEHCTLDATLLVTLVTCLIIFIFTIPVTSLFGGSGSPLLASVTTRNVHVCFMDLFFSNVGVISTACLDTSSRPMPKFVVSVLHNLMLVLPVTFLLTTLLKVANV